MVKKILDTFANKVIQDDKYNAAINKYVEDAKEFAGLSYYGYSLLENLYYDSVIFKKFILENEISIRLSSSGIVCYTFTELKNEILNYAAIHDIDITTLKKVMSLYETILGIAEMKDRNINMIARNFSEIVGISIMSKYSDETMDSLTFIEGDKLYTEYENNRECALNKIKEFYFVDGILDSIAYGYSVEMINQVFDHYINGNESYSIKIDENVMKRKRD